MDNYPNYPPNVYTQNNVGNQLNYGSLRAGHHVKYETYDNEYEDEDEWTYPSKTMGGRNCKPGSAYHHILQLNAQNYQQSPVSYRGVANGVTPPQYTSLSYPSPQPPRANNLSHTNNHIVQQGAVVRQLQEKFTGDPVDSTASTGNGNGGHVGVGVGGVSNSVRRVGDPGQTHPPPPSASPLPRRLNDQNGVDDGGGQGSGEGSGTWSNSFWLHGRIPLLILVVVLLLIVFLSFSGALIYFKCKLW